MAKDAFSSTPAQHPVPVEGRDCSGGQVHSSNVSASKLGDDERHENMDSPAEEKSEKYEKY